MDGQVDEKKLSSFINNPLQEDSDVSMRAEEQPEWNLAEELRVRTK